MALASHCSVGQRVNGLDELQDEYRCLRCLPLARKRATFPAVPVDEAQFDDFCRACIVALAGDIMGHCLFSWHQKGLD